jgi:hypothetical protein
MAKPENPAEAPVAARPPRPVQRVRLDALAEEALPEGALADGALPEGHYPNARAVHAGARTPVAPSAARRESLDVERRGVRRRVDHVFDADTFDASAFDTAAFDADTFDADTLDTGSFDASTFDTARNLEAPDGFLPEEGFGAEGERIDGGLSAEHSFSDEDGPDDADSGAGHFGSDAPASVAPVAARNASVEPRPGLAWVRRHQPAQDHAGSRAPQPGNGSEAAASRVPKLPMASLEMPSSSRLELTPSPVPRVALAPATGAVDISLVPGPHTIGSRNLPTLAAQHLLGRRAPRRPAPAVTLPPPPSREARSPLTLARDVRSSKGEIVLGLTIGLGVSLLLAGLGQAYLRGDVVADGSSAPAQLESVTLSARPDVAPAGSSETSNNGGGVTTSAPASPRASGTASVGTAAVGAPAGTEHEGSGARRHPGAAVGGAVAGDAVLLAQATLAKRIERTAQRATPARATRPRNAQRAESALAASADDSAHLPAAASPIALPSEPPPASAPLTPAESAGLGLDLPL